MLDPAAERLSGEEAPRLLIVDDEESARAGLTRILRGYDLDLECAASGDQALQRIFADGVDYAVVLIDYKMPGTNGLDVLRRIREERPWIQVVMITGHGSEKTKVEATQAGASAYIEKPFDITLIRHTVDRVLLERRVVLDNLALRRTLAEQTAASGGLIWADPAMRRVLQVAERIAGTDDPVLIEGESGTGKERLARFIHQVSARRDQKFLGISCGAFAEDLLVSELFGHEKGAFTGAESARAGLFETVAGGVLLLDEIGELPLSMQVRFLRVLEEKEIIRVGGRSPIKVSFRLLSTTLRDLRKMTEDGTFRQDLYYRLRVHYLRVPPLRERKADIPVLARHLLTRLALERKGGASDFDPEVLEMFGRHPWPGNVRELESLVRQSAVVASQDAITPDDLPEGFLSEVEEPLPPDGPEDEAFLTMQEARLQNIRKALEKTQGNRSQAARLLGIPRVSLQRMLNRYPELASIGKKEKK
jgi:DNA-binding NtrC family response regulator